MRFFLFCLLLLTGFSSGAETSALRVAVSAHQGQASPPPGLATFNRELAGEICRRIRVTCTLLDVPFQDILPGLEAKRFDLGLGSYLRTAEREARVAFSDAIWQSSSRLVGATTTSKRFAGKQGGSVTLDKLREARVAAVVGTRQHAFLESIAAGQNLKVVDVTSIAHLFRILRADQADFGLVVMLAAYAQLSEEAGGGLEFVGPPMHDRGLGGSVHIALQKDAVQLRQRVNQAIADMRSDGTYHRIVRRSFPFNLD